MGKREALIPSLASLLAEAKPLHEWARKNAGNVNVHRSLPSMRKPSSDHKRQIPKAEALAANHKVLDDFFAGLGFPPLSKNHTLSRIWDLEVAALRKEERKISNQERRKRQFHANRRKGSSSSSDIKRPTRKNDNIQST